MNKLLIMSFLAGLTLMATAMPAHAQTRIKKDSLEKTQWHHAPREFQIIDDRPIIRDFREAPSEAGTIEIPPGPQAMGSGGGGGGAMGGAPGSSLPSGGLQLGGPNQGFRSAPAGMGSLPKSGFGGTNIPARGMGPRGALPGINQGVVGKMMGQNKGVGAGAPRGMSPSTGRSTGSYNGPAVQSYSGGYGSGSGSGSGGSASRTDTMVRGTLLKR
jgi:hypothetical protein